MTTPGLKLPSARWAADEAGPVTEPELFPALAGAQVLGVLAARAAGQPFSEVLATRIFQPLGMRDTGFWTADTRRLATAYQPTPGGLVVLDEPAGKWSRPPEFGDGAAGLVSTADDRSPSPGCCCAAGRRCCQLTRCGP